MRTLKLEHHLSAALEHERLSFVVGHQVHHCVKRLREEGRGEEEEEGGKNKEREEVEEEGREKRKRREVRTRRGRR